MNAKRSKKNDYLRIVENIVEKAPDRILSYDDMRRTFEAMRLAEAAPDPNAPFKVGDRVSKKNHPGEQGRVNTVGHGQYEIYWDNGNRTIEKHYNLSRESQ